MNQLSTEHKTHKVSVKDENGRIRYLYLTDEQAFACIQAKDQKGHFTYKDHEGGMYSYPSRFLGSVEPIKWERQHGKTCTAPLGAFICFVEIDGERESVVRRGKCLVSDLSVTSFEYGYWTAKRTPPWRGQGYHPPHKPATWQQISGQELEKVRATGKL